MAASLIRIDSYLSTIGGGGSTSWTLVFAPGQLSSDLFS